MPVGELLERARAATERQQLDLADHYFCLAAQQHAPRVTKESVLDHASVLLLLGESARAATLAASLADPRQMSCSIFERAIYIQGAALLQAEDYAGSKAALERGLAVFPHSQQVHECRALHACTSRAIEEHVTRHTSHVTRHTSHVTRNRGVQPAAAGVGMQRMCGGQRCCCRWWRGQASDACCRSRSRWWRRTRRAA